MSEKNKTKIEKKLVASIALIITIGIASVVPLTFFMDNNAKAQTSVTDSLFNLNIPCAYYNVDIAYNVEINDKISNLQRMLDFYYRDAAVIAVQPSINYSVLDSNTVARIEIFEYTVYTNNLELQKSYTALSFNEQAFGQYTSKNPYGHMTSFAMKYWEETLLPKLGSGSKSFCSYGIDDPNEQMLTDYAGNNENFGQGNGKSIDKKHGNILAEVEKTQSVYIDVKRVAYISLCDDGTIVVVDDNKLLQHLELAKTNDGFMYGNPANVDREFYYGLSKIPYNGPYDSVPEDRRSSVWPDLFEG
ncbi:MAG: hypothetical protein LBE70_01280 [Nitrososphaerota archaeon]|jgi:hypothetical protein|nr:hypothetical protein [Nitrososphaerota archaeon]